MEQAVSPKTEDYDRIMKEKLERSRREENG